MSSLLEFDMAKKQGLNTKCFSFYFVRANVVNTLVKERSKGVF